MLSREETMAMASRHRLGLKIQNEIGFGDRKTKAPGIDFYPDYDQYFDSEAYLIHIGCLGIVNMFDVEDEATFLNALNYIRGHEEQHARSTASVPYRWAITHGVEVVLEYISSQVEPVKRRFRKPGDYKVFTETVLPSLGIHLSIPALQSIIGGIANSIEDGRIERIRSEKFAGYEKMRLVFRGIFWKKAVSKFKPYSEVSKDAVERLRIITNELLMLATCQIHSNGFATAYANTPLWDEVAKMKPHVARAVMSGTTRGMAKEVISLCEVLAPYIFEACRVSASDMAAQKALEEMIKDMIKSMLDKPATGHTLSETEEETDEGGMKSCFPVSDLVITLDDETYDKLMEKAKASPSSGGGIMIKREHPKEEESGENEEGKEKAFGTSKENEKEGKEKDGSFKASDKDAGEGTYEKSSLSGNGREEGKTPESNSSGDSKNDFGLKDGFGKDGGKGSDSEEVVLKAMKEAAESIRGEALIEIDNVNMTAAHESRLKGPEVEDETPVVSSGSVKDICDSFKEFKREYILTEPLPEIVARRGRTLLRKNQQYFRSLSTPNAKYLESGSVDPSRLAGLAMGETTIFKKRGMDRKFDGCVYILIDNSGSMSGNKRTEAAKAAAVIEESFRGLIPIKIVAFDSGSNVYHEVIKGFDEQKQLNCSWNWCLKGRTGGGTPTAISVRVAAREVLKRPERKKLVIVLTDGAPQDQEDTKAAISEARRKNVSIFGIYFEEGKIGRCASVFEDIFDNRDICMCALEDLDKNLETLMQKFARSR